MFNGMVFEAEASGNTASKAGRNKAGNKLYQIEVFM
jgi:hypothetical protein